MKIAVIDDEASVRKLLRHVFEAAGHEVLEANNGVVGLEMIQSQIPDLIVCDIRMPEMTGDELFDALHELDPDYGLIPFIFLSADGNEKEQIKRLNKGADNCFEKPIDMNLLTAYVNSHFSRMDRISGFIKRNLDVIAESVPKAVIQDFSSYKSLATNTHGYIEVIISAIHAYRSNDNNQQLHNAIPSVVEPCAEGAANTSCLNASADFSDELSYVKYCLERFEDRRRLVRAANGEDISWTLIFLVFHAELINVKIFVSDLYVSIPSAKSTINARINSLILDDVFNKTCDSIDGRRQQILLTDRFKGELISHVKTSIEMVKQVF